MLQGRVNDMDNTYINRVMAAIYDTGIVANQFDFTNDFLFVDVSLCSGQKPESFLLDFDEENKNLNIIARFGEWFSTDIPHVNALMYIALETANGAIHDVHAPGRVLLNLDEENGARFMYSACVPLLLLPQEMAAFVKRAAEAVMAVRDFLTCFAQHANEGSISIDDAVELEPLEEGQMRVTLHPALAILSDTDINVSEDQEEE